MKESSNLLIRFLRQICFWIDISYYCKANILFVQDSTKEIRKAINAPHPRLGEDHDPQKDFVFEHVKTTIAD